MEILLNNLSDTRVNSSNRKRLGRGIGSGKGKTSGKGHKGQKARAGAVIGGFEGGQNPIHRRLPKRGFNNYTRVTWQVLNLGDLQKFVDAGKIDVANVVTKEVLLASNLLRKKDLPLKILGKGDLSSKLSFDVDAASETAVKKIEKLGGKVVISASKEVAA